MGPSSVRLTGSSKDIHLRGEHMSPLSIQLAEQGPPGPPRKARGIPVGLMPELSPVSGDPPKASSLKTGERPPHILLRDSRAPPPPRGDSFSSLGHSALPLFSGSFSESFTWCIWKRGRREGKRGAGVGWGGGEAPRPPRPPQPGQPARVSLSLPLPPEEQPRLDQAELQSLSGAPQSPFGVGGADSALRGPRNAPHRPPRLAGGGLSRELGKLLPALSHSPSGRLGSGSGSVAPGLGRARAGKMGSCTAGSPRLRGPRHRTPKPPPPLLLLLLLLLPLPPRVGGFNLESEAPAVLSGPPGSFFGFSVEFYRPGTDG